MSDTRSLLPWHEAAWTQIGAARTAGRLPHALLLHGLAGLGKQAFAHQLANLCLCESPPAGLVVACGACRGCRLFAARTHPDLHLVQPEEGKVSLGIDQIRDLTRELVLQPHTARVKVAMLAPAEWMTPAAANALLKTLEEPPGATLLMLVTARPAALPATIRSRCQAIRFRAPPLEQAVAWLGQQSREAAPWVALLEMTGGAPLQALALAGSDAAELAARLGADLGGIVEGRVDPLEVAARWARQERALWLTWLQRHVGALIRHKVLSENSGTGHSKATATLPNYGGNLNLTALLQYWDAVLLAQRQLQGQANEQLVLEALLIPWAHRLDRVDRRG